MRRTRQNAPERSERRNFGLRQGVSKREKRRGNFPSHIKGKKGESNRERSEKTRILYETNREVWGLSGGLRGGSQRKIRVEVAYAFN